MTPKTFFTIVIKIFGMYLVYSALQVIPQGITTVVYFKNAFEEGTGILLGIIFTVVIMAVYFLILYTCLYKTDWIINKLALSEHFTEERFEINVHRSTVLQIAVIAVGALIFIDALPAFCHQIFNYFKENQLFPLVKSDSGEWALYYFVQMFIGYFLMTSNRPIVNFIERQRKKNPGPVTEENQNPD